MFFFLKRKKIVVDCFTHNHSVKELFPIDYYKKFIPDWYKLMPSTTEITNNLGLKYPISTLKKCPSVIETFNRGFSIPIWSDLKIKVDEKQWVAQYASDEFTIQSHFSEQFPKAFHDKYFSIKLSSPWYIKEKNGITFSWQQPLWNHLYNLSKYHIIPGMLNFKYQNSSMVNIILMRSKWEEIIEAGTPLVHLIPMSEYDVIIKNHLVSKNEWINISTAYRSKFTGSYAYNKKILSKNEKKCPFGFGK